MDVSTILITVAAGAAVGIISAIFGIGGGSVMVPFMVLMLGMGQHVAEGTSLLVVVPTSIAGVIAHRKSKYVSMRNFLGLGIAGVVGAVLGARVALLLEGDQLRTFFALFLAAVGVNLFFRGLRQGRADR
ncbi:MAG: sulfite exporter TauE/SafE family protein [Actinomycetota bacterium]